MFDRARFEAKQVVLATLRAMVRTFAPALLSPASALELLDFFIEVERLGAAGKTLAAGRAAEGTAWRDAGERSPADWLAKRTGSTIGEARGALDTAAKLPDAPATDAAFRDAALSPKQAEAIAAAAAADPSSEQRLLEMAEYQSLQKLRDESARVRHAADRDPEGTRERIRRNRFWKKWTDADGSRRGSYSLPPEDAARLEAAAQPFLDARLDTARRDGEFESTEAYAADALVDMAVSTTEGDGSAACAGARGARGRKRLRGELFCLVDLAALRRGMLHPGEVCEIPGIGPVSLEVVREVFGDALLRIVIRDGVDIRTVVHAGRKASAVQETAIIARQVGKCGVGTCGLPIVEIDHRLDFAVHGAATLDDLVGLCGHHHDLKSLFGHSWRREDDGSVTWIRADGTEERQHAPP